MSTANPRFSNASAPNKVEGVVENVKDKAEGIGSAVADGARHVRDNVKDMAGSAADTAEKAWDTTRHAAEEFGTEVSRRAETVHADAVIFIRRNPVATVLGAVGVGMMLGAVLFAGARSRD